ncbi:MAG: replication-associated recombination protein A [Clostridia bacterium]|nr:replication-associated recombination protein A [Clostridia bacterium]
MPSLAEKIRPHSFDEVVGQKHLINKGSLFRNVIESGNIPNMIFYGPPGTGKTTVAEIIAKSSNRTIRKLNATTCSLADVKAVCEETGSVFGESGILLYLDEIQYFNKKQQQSLLEYMEDGRITLIGATTENPYHAIYAAVLSRSSIFEFKAVDSDEIAKALYPGYEILKNEYKTEECADIDAVIKEIAYRCSGDVRRAVGTLELCFLGTSGNMTVSDVDSAISSFGLKMDKDGNEHYDLLSALQKSVRGSDENAALFYLARLLEGGDLLSPCRRIMIMACEDIGLAYPQAIPIVKACVDIALQVGLPEASLPLSDAVILLATAPKSNSGHDAYARAAADVRSGLGVRVPDYLRDSTQPSANKNADYKYPHVFPNHYVKQQYLPDEIKNRVYYEYGENKTEQAAKAYWEKIKK